MSNILRVESFCIMAYCEGTRNVGWPLSSTLDHGETHAAIGTQQLKGFDALQKTRPLDQIKNNLVDPKAPPPIH